MGKSKYKRLTDLFVVGTEVVFDEDTVIWVQALNPYERDEAISDAQVARSRLIMAMREAGDERLKVEARMEERGLPLVIKELAQAKAADKMGEFADDIRASDEWRERIQILERSDLDQISKPLEPVEAELLLKINREFVDELVKREEAERDFLEQRYERLNRDEILDEYLDLYLERRGSEVAQTEFVLTQMWYGARECEGKLVDGVWDHSTCNGHRERIWDSKGEVRSLPEALQDRLHAALGVIEMSPREAKNSDRQGSSSDSSPLPSEPAESTPSTQDETQEAPPGTSLSPSLTA